MFSDISYVIVIVLVSITIIVTSIAIIIAVKFQKLKKKKYNDFIQIINEKKDATFSVKDGLTPDEIYSIDSSVNIESLMNELYNTYLKFEDKIKNYDINLDDTLVGYLKDFYLNKMKNSKQNGYSYIKDGIDLIGYSITEFNKENLKFRININCFDYKMINNEIVSGSNLFKVEQILLLSYKKVNNDWLISSYDKIYEKKLSN